MEDTEKCPAKINQPPNTQHVSPPNRVMLSDCSSGDDQSLNPTNFLYWAFVGSKDRAANESSEPSSEHDPLVWIGEQNELIYHHLILIRVFVGLKDRRCMNQPILTPNLIRSLESRNGTDSIHHLILMSTKPSTKGWMISSRQIYAMVSRWTNLPWDEVMAPTKLSTNVSGVSSLNPEDPCMAPK